MMTYFISKRVSSVMATGVIVIVISDIAFATESGISQIDRSNAKIPHSSLRPAHQLYTQIPPPPDSPPPGPPPEPPGRDDWDRDYRRQEREDLENCLDKDDRSDRLDCLDNVRDRMRRRHRWDRRVRDRDDLPLRN
jgi:hypothetical protein